MNKFLFLFFSILSLQIAVAKDGELKSIIKTFSSSAKDPSIDYTANCANCPKEIKTNKQASLHSKYTTNVILLTVLTLEEATQVFNELAENPEIPFGYPVDGCYARAQKMTILMEKKGIISGKAWVTGDILVDTYMGQINWIYHVAPVVLVQEKLETVPYVIDPSLHKKPVPFSEWKKNMLQKSGSDIDDDYYTSRFAFFPGERDTKRDHYDEDHNATTEETSYKYLNFLNQDPDWNEKRSKWQSK